MVLNVQKMGVCVKENLSEVQFQILFPDIPLLERKRKENSGVVSTVFHENTRMVVKIHFYDLTRT